MDIDYLRNNNLILLECISGSKAYNLDVPSSDTDLKGVFYLPKEKFYGFEYIPQISDANNDEVFYEIGRFVDLLAKNNPNILELLATPSGKTIYRHPIMDRFKTKDFLSKKCKDTFGGYAFTQVKKARGLKKKIVNPMSKVKKSILDFCYVLHRQGSIALTKWLEVEGKLQSRIGLVNVPHCKDTYGLYYSEHSTAYNGVMKKENATTVLLSSIPKQEVPVSYMHFNQDGFIKYCKDYKEYWDWVKKRNAARYENNVQHGKNYDSKNMMHTFRLLYMAEEILKDGQILVERDNREELLKIRNGDWEYDELIDKANEKMSSITIAYEESKLQEQPDLKMIERLLVDVRKELYR